MSRRAVRPALQKLLHVMVALFLPHLPFPRNWLSSHCQVCLILSCLTRCYLEPRLSGPLNPFVTHNNKKLGRCSLSGDWEEDRWTSGKFGWEEGKCATVTSFWLFFSAEWTVSFISSHSGRRAGHRWRLWAFLMNLMTVRTRSASQC